MDVVHFTETSVNQYYIAWDHIPENTTRQIRLLEAEIKKWLSDHNINFQLRLITVYNAIIYVNFNDTIAFDSLKLGTKF
jgi:glutamate 5-kinase